ncbi:MAG TPA: DNA polymerase/3'-5' exonuclease PolX [Methanomassiliicoccales archaeon]|nr:DNA polymerase/3'-5' exonuclease PolX [Methanomassiliicoccales archaeon]
MRNAEVARVLYEIADLLELQGVNFKPNAYRKAARSIENLTDDIEQVHKEDKLRDIPGVGDAIAKKLDELLTTGNLGYLEELRKQFPPGLLQIMAIPELGPKTAVHLYNELKITNLDELKKAVEEHRIQGLKGFGPRSEERILQGIALVEGRTGRMLLGRAYPVAMQVLEYVRSKANLEKISLAGSLRRMKETIGDIDLIAGSDDAKWVMDVFTTYPEVEDVIMRGPTKSSLRLKGGLQVDLRVVKEVEYGAALQYFTGSKDHNIVLRQMAIDKGMKLNEYALSMKETGAVVARETEEDIYKALGLEIMPPEIRENRGEIEASLQHKLPKLIELTDIMGDLHVHTKASDGDATMEEIAYACKRRGYEYVGFTDHSKRLGVAGGLSVEELRGSIDVARNVSELVPEVRVFLGSECEILEDGKLDYPNGVLKDLDYVIGAVHSKFNMPKKEMTDRIATALSNENLTILAHPTGRKLEQREPYAVDVEGIMQAAKDNGVCLELDSFPERLDLNDVHCRQAKDVGATVVIDSDSHSIAQLDFMTFGVATARRGWLEKDEVLNTKGRKQIEAFLKK